MSDRTGSGDGGKGGGGKGGRREGGTGGRREVWVAGRDIVDSCIVHSLTIDYIDH